jgi:hypothetical protein
MSIPKIEYIIVTCDYNPKFLNFLPTVYHHWKNMGYKVAFGLLHHSDISSRILSVINNYCDAFHFFKYDRNTSFSTVCMAKLYRFYLSRFYPESVICIQDIDYYVLDRHAHVESTLDERIDTSIFTYAFNAYYNAPPYPSIMKFPASPTVGLGKNIYRMFSLDTDISYDHFLTQIQHVVMRIPEFSDESYISMLSPDFSDERLIRKLLTLKRQTIVYMPRTDFDLPGGPYRIDRSTNCTAIGRCVICDTTTCMIHSLRDMIPKLIDVQPMRPLDTKHQTIKDIFEHLRIPKEVWDVKIII